MYFGVAILVFVAVFLVFAAIFLVVSGIKQQQIQTKILMKISDMAATLINIDTAVVAMDASIKAVTVSVAALVTAGQNADLPPDVQAALDKLQADTAQAATDMAALNAAANPTPAPPAA